MIRVANLIVRAALISIPFLILAIGINCLRGILIAGPQ